MKSDEGKKELQNILQQGAEKANKIVEQNYEILKNKFMKS